MTGGTLSRDADRLCVSRAVYEPTSLKTPARFLSSGGEEGVIEKLTWTLTSCSDMPVADTAGKGSLTLKLIHEPHWYSESLVSLRKES